MKIVIIGSVAAGTSAAAKARRNSEDAKITVYEKDSFISYSGCGLPYFIGGEVTDIGKLTPRDSKWFKERYDVDIKTGCEVLSVDTASKTLKIRNLVSGDEFSDEYDKLVIATGAKPFKPPIAGTPISNVFTVRNPQDAMNIHAFIVKNNAKKAVIVGGGYIGLEMAEALVKRGMGVTIIELGGHVIPKMDDDMAAIVQDNLNKNGVKILVSSRVSGFKPAGGMAQAVVIEGREDIPADLIIWSAGIKPEVELAKKMGVEIGETGAISIDKRMQTNLPDVYAAGDCAQGYSLITGKPLYVPLGSTANKMGRIAGDVITGGSLQFKGVLGTGIFKVFNMSVAMTGLTQQQAAQSGYNAVAIHNIKPNIPDYLPGSTEMHIKAVADRDTGRLLGVQITGGGGVDKRIDVFATAITYGARAAELFDLDLAYAPPFATTKDPVHYTGMILDNAINHGRRLMAAGELINRKKSGEKIVVVDVRSQKDRDKGFIEGSVHIPLQALRAKLTELDKNDVIVVYCNKGVTGNAAQNVLINHGFEKVYNLSGGYNTYKSAERGA